MMLISFITLNIIIPILKSFRMPIVFINKAETVSFLLETPAIYKYTVFITAMCIYFSVFSLMAIISNHAMQNLDIIFILCGIINIRLHKLKVSDCTSLI